MFRPEFGVTLVTTNPMVRTFEVVTGINPFESMTEGLHVPATGETEHSIWVSEEEMRVQVYPPRLIVLRLL